MSSVSNPQGEFRRARLAAPSSRLLCAALLWLGLLANALHSGEKEPEPPAKPETPETAAPAPAETENPNAAPEPAPPEPAPPEPAPPEPAAPEPAPPEPAPPAPEPTVSFRNDVLPVLTRAGCNLGACHGAQTGKGELLLSLRGENPADDYEALVGSYVNRDAPDRSYLLRKAVADVSHEGGVRFADDSESYAILERWIEEGAPFELPDEPVLVALEVSPEEKVLFDPENSVRIEAKARFSDGSVRDVNRWAIYEPTTLTVEVNDEGTVTRLRGGEATVNVRYLGVQAPVRLAFVPERPGFVWSDPPAANYIDEALHAKWRTLRLLPSEPCDDATYLRRVHLDLLGFAPSAEEAEAFLADEAPDKRARLVDKLLERPEFADFWTLKWADLLRLEEKVLDRKGVAAFHGWIRQSILENKPVDRFAREIVTALGSTYEVAPANYYRALRSPEDRAEAVAQIFLGVRLNCAKCHNHPSEKWTMDEYYHFAAIFDGIDYEIVENERFDKNDKNNFVGEQVVHFAEERAMKHPRSGEHPEPRLLGEAAEIQLDEERLEALGAWMTSPEHPLFAQVQANRIWSHLMGRGIVEPVDDFRITNPPVNPALLEALTADFVASGFDLRHLVRTICASQAYQLGSTPNAFNEDDEDNFARAVPRRLAAEQILDSTHRFFGTLPEFEGYDEPMRAAQLPGVQAVYRPKSPSHGDTFLKLFGKPGRLANSDTERSGESSLAQVFELTSGQTLNSLLTAKDNRLDSLIAEHPDTDDAAADNEALVRQIYREILTREPAEQELAASSSHLAGAESRRAALEDLAWALLNAKEFLLRP